MNQQQIEELLETISDKSHELCSMIQAMQEIEGRNPSESWLFIFREITKAWFSNDNQRLQEISNFIVFGGNGINPRADITSLIFGPGPLTNH